MRKLQEPLPWPIDLLTMLLKMLSASHSMPVTSLAMGYCASPVSAPTLMSGVSEVAMCQCTECTKTQEKKRKFSFGFLVFVAFAAILSIFLDGGMTLFSIVFLFVCYKIFWALVGLACGINPRLW